MSKMAKIYQKTIFQNLHPWCYKSQNIFISLSFIKFMPLKLVWLLIFQNIFTIWAFCLQMQAYKRISLFVCLYVGCMWVTNLYRNDVTRTYKPFIYKQKYALPLKIL